MSEFVAGERAGDRLLPCWLVALLFLTAAVPLLFFLQTADPVFLLAGIVLPLLLVKARWVYVDARRVGLPAGLWLCAIPGAVRA